MIIIEEPNFVWSGSERKFHETLTRGLCHTKTNDKENIWVWSDDNSDDGARHYHCGLCVIRRATRMCMRKLCKVSVAIQRGWRWKGRRVGEVEGWFHVSTSFCTSKYTYCCCRRTGAERCGGARRDAWRCGAATLYQEHRNLTKLNTILVLSLMSLMSSYSLINPYFPILLSISFNFKYIDHCQISIFIHFYFFQNYSQLLLETTE